MNTLQTFLEAACKDVVGLAKINVPSDVISSLASIEGIEFVSHDSHLFLLINEDGEVIGAHNLPRA